MLNLRNQSVTVNRLELIAALHKGREEHRVAIIEATTDYKAATIKFLGEALDRANSGVFTDLTLRLSAPVSRDADYADVIDMLEVSVDETITLDKEAYKAYYKNEWPWTSSLYEMAGAYKASLLS